MAPDSEHNPYSPPQAMEPAAISEGRQLVPSWWRWTIVTILVIVLINVAFLSTGRLMTMGYPVGQGIAFCCGVFVLGMAVLAGRRFTFLRALGLVQVMNVLTWATMLVTVYLLLPYTIGQNMRARELPIFLWLCMGGAVAVVAAIGVGSLFRISFPSNAESGCP